MKNHNQKRSEWNDQALVSEDPKVQVARPGEDFEFSRLVDDIKNKLHLDGSSNSILDVGCGNGLLLSALAGGIEKISGVDYADAMVSKAKSSIPNGHFEAGPANRLTFNSNEYSRVLCYSIFHYFPDVNYAQQTLNELVRVCRPGGVILVGDLLDKNFETQIKGGSDLEIESQRPKIHRYSEWAFYDLEELTAALPGDVVSVEILDQPKDFKLRHYRKDVRICL